MMQTIYAEVELLRKRPSTWILLGIWAVMSGMFGYVVPYIDRNEAAAGGGITDLLPASVATTALSGFPFFGGVIVLIMAVMAFGGDYGWNVVKTLFTQRSSRLQVFGSKFAAIAIWLLPFVLVTFAVSIVASLIVASAESASNDLQSIGTIAVGLLAAWLILAVWAALGILLATLTRGTSIAIGVGILYGLVIEGLLSAFLDGVDALSPLIQGLLRTNAYSLVQPIGDISEIARGNGPGAFSGPYVGGAQSLAVLIAYLAALTATSALIINRRDVA